jgi:hypothetical protein
VHVLDAERAKLEPGALILRGLQVGPMAATLVQRPRNPFPS